LETIQAIENHAASTAKASQQFAQDPIGTVGYGTLGTIDSVGKAALDTAEGWAWVAQNPGTAWETTKLVGGDVLRNLEDQMHRDPSGFAMQTVINLGTLLSPTSRAGTSFTLTPLKTANTAENIVTTAVPIIDGSVPKIVGNGGATLDTSLLRNADAINLQQPNLVRGNTAASDDFLSSMRNHRDVVIAKPGSDDMALLDYFGANANMNEGVPNQILLRPEARKIEVLEEFLHGTQIRNGILDKLGHTNAEIHVKDFMIRHQNMLGLSDEDIQALKTMKDSYMRK
jgi:hypothetical protein